jgi:hypothetical protein
MKHWVIDSQITTVKMLEQDCYDFFLFFAIVVVAIMPIAYHMDGHGDNQVQELNFKSMVWTAVGDIDRSVFSFISFVVIEPVCVPS